MPASNNLPVALSSDAPYASVDPWATVRAAVNRTTPSGAVLGRDEVLGRIGALLGDLAHEAAGR